MILAKFSSFKKNIFQTDSLCKQCFFYCFETEIHETIIHGKLFQRGEKVAIGASGGKGLLLLFSDQNSG